MTQTIEDVILKTNKVDLNKSDKLVLLSLRSQVLKNLSLTDRQYVLAKEKLLKYKDELYALGITDLLAAMSVLGSPIRYIDRSKTITVVAITQDNNLFRHSGKYIKIDFPFNKKTIAIIDNMTRNDAFPGYVHPRNEKSHYFPLTELNITTIVNLFKERNFDIDQELIDDAAAINTILANKSLHVPGIYNNQMLNLKPAAIALILEETILEDPNRLIKLYNRRFRYGLGHVDVDTTAVEPTSVLSKIINRDQQYISINLADNYITELSAALDFLEHFPILVMIDSKFTLEQITMLHQAFPNITNDEQCVLFREPSGKGDIVNTYIKENNLNNWVDANTKIVYINKKKLPKILLNSKWQPKCTISFLEQRSCDNIRTYTNQHADLIIHLIKQVEKK